MPFFMKTYYYYMIHPQVLDIWNTGTEYRARAVKHNPFTCCSHLLVNISFLFSNRFSYLSSKNKAKRWPLHPASPNNNRTDSLLLLIREKEEPKTTESTWLLRAFQRPSPACLRRAGRGNKVYIGGMKLLLKYPLKKYTLWL